MNPFNPIKKTNPFNAVGSTTPTTKAVSNTIPTTFSKPGLVNLAGLPYLEGGGAMTPAGIAYNTVVGLPQGAVDFAKGIGQMATRAAGSVGITAGNIPTDILNKVGKATGGKTYQPIPPPFEQSIDMSGTEVGRQVFGDRPVKTVGKSITDTQKTLEPYLGKSASTLFAPTFVFGGIALDLSDFGGRKGIKSFVKGEVPEAFFKFVAKETNEQVLKSTLKKIGLDDFNAKLLADKLALTKTVGEAKDVTATFERAGLVPRGGGTPQPARAPDLALPYKKAEEVINPQYVDDIKFYKGVEDSVVNQPSLELARENAVARIDEIIRTTGKEGSELFKMIVDKFGKTDARKILREGFMSDTYTPKQINAIFDNKLAEVLKPPVRDTALSLPEAKTPGDLSDEFLKRGQFDNKGNLIDSPANDALIAEIEAVKSQKPQQFTPGPGYLKFSNGIDNMVRGGTLLPEDATILKTLFEGSDDAYLGTYNLGQNTRFKNLFGRFQIQGNEFTGYKPQTNKLELARGLAKRGEPATRVFAHEFGHGGYYLALNSGERQMVSDIFHQLGRQKARSIFDKGLAGNVAHHAKNPREFFAESFAEYILENKVPAAQMKPLLQRLATKFFEAIKRLVNRGEIAALKRLRPLFERALTGDRVTPLAEMMAKEPPSFKQEVAAMMETMTPGTKEVPVESLMPPIPQSIANNPVAQTAYVDSLQKQIIDAREAQKALEAFNAVPPDPLEFPSEAMQMRDVAKEMEMENLAPTLKDIGHIKKNTRDIFRNTEQVFGPNSLIEKKLLDPLDNSKGQMVTDWSNWLDDLSTSVTEKFGIQQGTKASGAIELYGEGKVTLPELVEQFGEVKARQIVEADAFFRDRYAFLLNKLNEVEKLIYPNSPHKWTPKLENYYRHGANVASDFSRLKNILDNPIKVDSLIAGKTEDLLPKSKWQSFKQRRLGGMDRKPDAIGGYLDYIKAVGYSINIDPNVGRFRELADILRRTTQLKVVDNVRTGQNLENYIYNLDKFANQLAGKSPEVDRIINDLVGRRPLQALDWLNNRAKSNTVLLSNSSSLAQILNLPQGFADMGLKNSIEGLKKTMGQAFAHSETQAKSTFLKERYFKGFDKFDKSFLSNPRKFAVWGLTVLDEVSSKIIWNGEYEKALSLGVSDPVRYADKITRKLVGGRGVGEKSLLQSSKAFQLVAPFQLEITNLWYVMEDIAKSNKSLLSKFGSFASLFLMFYVFNNVIEKATGNRPVLDPIDATIDGVGKIFDEPNLKGVAKAGGRLFGEALSNVPLGQSVAGLYPEYGTSILPPRKDFFGEGDPTRYGGMLLARALQDPLFKLAPPFGGGQVKKSLQGISSVAEGKVRSKAGNFLYPIEQTPTNYLRGTLFGRQGLPETRAYYDKKTTGTKSAVNPFNAI